MKSKKLIILTVIFAALIVLAVIKKTAVKPQAVPFEKAQESVSFELVSNISEDFTSKIIFYKGDDQDSKVVFSKNPSGIWILESRFGAKARADIPANLIKDLSGLKGELRADSNDVLTDFEISDNQGLHIVVMNTADKEGAHLVVGLKIPRWGENFIRLYGTSKVALVKKNLLMTLGLPDPKGKLEGKTFVDFKLFSVDLTKEAARVESRLASGALIALTKSDNGTTTGWQFDPSDPEHKIDENKVTEFLNTLSNLYAQDVIDPSGANYGFDSPGQVISLNVKDKDATVAYKLELGKFDATQKIYYLRLTPEGLVYLIPEGSAVNLKKDKTFFLQQPAPSTPQKEAEKNKTKDKKKKK